MKITNQKIRWHFVQNILLVLGCNSATEKKPVLITLFILKEFGRLSPWRAPHRREAKGDVRKLSGSSST